MIWSRCFSLALKITAAFTSVVCEGLLSDLLSRMKLYSSMSSFFLLGTFQEMSMYNSFPQNLFLVGIRLVTG